jgi:DNA primase
MAHQFGCTNVVATLGTSFTAGHSRILKRYAKKIVLLFDSDTAGIEAANRALEICLLQRIDIKLASVPEGKDPCDFLLAAGKERFEELIDNATDVFEFKWKRLKKTFGSGGTLIDNKAAIEEFMQAIAAAVRAGNLQAVDRGVIVNRLSKITGLEARQINLELDRRQKTMAKTANYPGAAKMENQKVQRLDLGDGLAATAQREILEVLLNEPKLFEEVKQKITPEAFDVPILGKIASVLFETLGGGETSLSAVLARIESVELGNAIAGLAQAGEEKGNFNLRLSGAIEVMQRRQSQKKKGEIKSTKDQKQFLRNACETASKRNPHNIGMV